MAIYIVISTIFIMQNLKTFEKEFKCSFKFIDDEINDCNIFYGCYNLKSIDLSSYQGLKIVDRYYHGIHAMFSNTSMENIKLCPIECVGKECDYSNFLYGMFDDNPLLTYVDLTVCKILRKSIFLIFYFLFQRTTAF